MKKYILWLILLFIVFPHNTFAYVTFHDENQLHIENNIEENTYIAGGKINITGNIVGDLVMAGGELVVNGDIRDNAIIAGGNIEINKTIGEDLIIAGGDVEINSIVLGDIRAAGGNITLEQSASGDVNIVGGSIKINKNVTIGRDIGFIGENIIINGLIQGKADIIAENLDLDGTITKDVSLRLEETKNLYIGPNAKIMGKLTYKSYQRIPELEKIAVGGATYTGIPEFSPKKDNTEMFYGFVSMYILYRFLFLLIIGSILLYTFPHFIRKTAEIVQKTPGKSFLYGLLYLILVPVISVLLFITIIGVPLGILSIAIYVFSFIFAKLITLIVMTELINAVWKDKISQSWQKWSIFTLLALIITIISGVDLIATIFAFGAIIIFIGKSYSHNATISHN